MPTLTQTTVQGFAYCHDARCSGYAEQEVEAIREESSWSFAELGGDGPFANMIERSQVTFRCASEDDVPCPACASPREVSGSPRPQYQPLSGHDPMGLLNVPRFEAGKFVEPGQMTPTPDLLAETDEEMEERLRAELKEEMLKTRLRREMATEDDT